MSLSKWSVLLCFVCVQVSLWGVTDELAGAGGCCGKVRVLWLITGGRFLRRTLSEAVKAFIIYTLAFGAFVVCSTVHGGSAMISLLWNSVVLMNQNQDDMGPQVDEQDAAYCHVAVG